MGIKSTSERSIAVFIDFENLALGFNGRNDRFDIRIVLKRLLEKGKIVAKKAYADWNRFSTYTGSLHEAAIELVEIPRRGQTGKNSADIRLCVDAMDLAYSKEHIDTFVVVSGDSDFSPLVSKLKELGKHVIGLGMSTSTSNLLRDNCDEFIYYEDLTQDVAIDQVIKTDLPDSKRKAFMLLLNAANAMRRDNREILHPSQIKATMQRMKPSFNETYHGYRTFSALLEDAQREGLLILDTDKRSGTYVVTHVGSEIEGGKMPRALPPLSTALPVPVAPPQGSSSEPAPVSSREGDIGASDEAPLTAKPSRGRRRRGGRGRRRNGGEGLGPADTSGQAAAPANDEQEAPSIGLSERPSTSPSVLQEPGLPPLLTAETPPLKEPRARARVGETARKSSSGGRTPARSLRIQETSLPAAMTTPLDAHETPARPEKPAEDAVTPDTSAVAPGSPPAKKRRSRGGRGRGKPKVGTPPTNGDAPDES